MKEGKSIKSQILDFMEENVNYNGYTSKELSEICDTTNNMARESLVSLIRDGKVFRASKLNYNCRKTFVYFLTSQKETEAKAKYNEIDPSILSRRKK